MVNSPKPPLHHTAGTSGYNLVNEQNQQPATSGKPTTSHPRLWRAFRYVYPVISRRAAGLSIGVNLNLDKACNFACLYCQAASEPTPDDTSINLPQIEQELDAILDLVAKGDIWHDPPFDATPPAMRVPRDIAFSGNGEPTLRPELPNAMRIASQVKAKHHLTDARLTLITNATRLHMPSVQQALAIMDEPANHGQVWAKLDAGTETFYQQINQSKTPLAKVLRNISYCGQHRPIVIQTMLLKLDGQPMPDDEFGAYLNQLKQLVEQRCQLRQVQLYTIARSVRDDRVAPLSNDMLDQFAERVRAALPHVSVITAYSRG